MQYMYIQEYRHIAPENIGAIDMAFYTNGEITGRMIAKSLDDAEQIATFEVARARACGFECYIGRGFSQYRIYMDAVA